MPRVSLPRATPAKLLLPALAAASVVAAACSRTSAAPAGGARPPAKVQVAAAVKRDVPVYLDAIGKTAAREVVTLRAQVSGPVTGIHFADGAEVHRGDLLFTIDPRPYRAQLDAALAALAQNEASLDLARSELARAEKLVKTEAVTRQEYEARRSAFQVGEAQVRASRAAVDTARLNLEYCSVRAPIDGRAGQRQVDLGNVVTPGGVGTALVVLQRLDPMYAEFTIPENDLPRVQRAMWGDPAAQGVGSASTSGPPRLTARVRLPDEPETGGRQGDLTFLDSAVQAGSGTVKLRATLDNRDRRFWPGEFVRVRLVLGTDRGAVLVPADAPQVSAKGPFVYVVKADGTAELRPVHLGQRQGDLVAVSTGVAPGEQVVTAGHLAVIPGGKVQVADAPAGKLAQAAGREGGVR